MVSVSPGGSGRAGLSGDCITLQRLESGAGFASSILEGWATIFITGFIITVAEIEVSEYKINLGRKMHKICIMLDTLTEYILPNAKKASYTMYMYIGVFIWVEKCGRYR